MKKFIIFIAILVLAISCWSQLTQPTITDEWFILDSSDSVMTSEDSGWVDSESLVEDASSPIDSASWDVDSSALLSDGEPGSADSDISNNH